MTVGASYGSHGSQEGLPHLLHSLAYEVFNGSDGIVEGFDLFAQSLVLLRGMFFLNVGAESAEGINDLADESDQVLVVGGSFDTFLAKQSLVLALILEADVLEGVFLVVRVAALKFRSLRVFYLHGCLLLAVFPFEV